MRTMKQFSMIYMAVLLIVVFCILMCSGDKVPEISNQSDVVSCKFFGLGERDGQPIVQLTFKNNSGKNLKSLYGGLRIVNSNGDVVQRTGFTYSRPFLANEEKVIPAFAYVALKEESLKILESASDFVPMRFELSEVVFEDDTSLKY